MIFVANKNKKKRDIYLFATYELALKRHAKFFCLTTSAKPSDRKISITFLCLENVNSTTENTGESQENALSISVAFSTSV